MNALIKAQLLPALRPEGSVASGAFYEASSEQWYTEALTMAHSVKAVLHRAR